jgi:predicted nucleotide-binding protein (sugar kinase/HSP70/actin superfamily)
VEYLIELAQPYLDVSFSGEAILSIGKAIEYFHKGAGGIVNTLPFNCMPGTVVSSISKRVSEDLGGLPWLNLAYEGLSEKGDALKLEAFVHQARQFSHLE